MEGVEVPSYFLCPISLQLMRDPVTLPTGITYDRDSIETWFSSSSSGKDNTTTCPITKQPLLADCNILTPNHTLRRLIQAWCVVNASFGIERFPTPRPPVDADLFTKLLAEAKMPNSRMDSLRKLKAVVSESDRNRRCVEASGAVDVLASIVKSSIASKDGDAADQSTSSTCDEALGILYSLKISKTGRRRLLETNQDFIETLTSIMQRRSSGYDSRVYATLLIKSLLSVIPTVNYSSLREELFHEIVGVLQDRISYQATKAALKILIVICPCGSNRVKAVEAGAASVLIELLLEEPERRPCEMILVVLDQLCRCADGRAVVVGHAAGIAVVSKKLVRVSQVATEMAVRLLYSIAKLSATKDVLQEMLQVGAVSKLCVLLQMDCGVKTKEKVNEVLRLHSKVWRNSPCIPATRMQLNSYPSS